MKIKFSTIGFGVIIVFSLLIGFLLKEDSLGGARHDYLYYLNYFSKFNENFLLTFKNYGLDQENQAVRNSPIFYILGSLLIKINVSINYLILFNLFITMIMCCTFYYSLKLKYGNNNLDAYFLLSLIILLSPTTRSLIIWPYPILVAHCFFLVSIFFYLKFKNEKKEKNKFIFALINCFFLAFSSYFTPNFSIFSLYFFINYLIYYKFNYKILFILILNIVLSFPALLFLVKSDFYLFKSNVMYLNNALKYNFFNKIIIISSFLFLFFLPMINYKLIFKKISLKTDKEVYLIILFILINIYFFNFIRGAGGGIFFHLSSIFDTNLIIFITFILSMYIFYVHKLIILDNIIIFALLVLYNLQFSIYYKYYDPLIFFTLFLMFKNIKFDFNSVRIKYAIFYVLFLLSNIGKVFLNY